MADKAKTHLNPTPAPKSPVSAQNTRSASGLRPTQPVWSDHDWNWCLAKLPLPIWRNWASIEALLGFDFRRARAPAKLPADRAAPHAQQLHEAAAHGISAGSEELPFLDRIQQSFGHHDVSSVKAHLGPRAIEGNQAMRAAAFTTRGHVAFAGTPSLHTVAHEAAHIVQQRAGVQLRDGIGEAGDRYERDADAVADRVVAGKSSQALLDAYVGSALRASHRSAGQSIALQRKPADKTTAAQTPSPAKEQVSAPPALKRTLYIVQNDIWNQLPAAVRTSAEQQLNALFSFVGKADKDKPFSIQIRSAEQLPEALDFTESVVTLIHGDPNDYVDRAFARQNEQIKRWLAANKVKDSRLPLAAAAKLPGSAGPESTGIGGGSSTLLQDKTQSYAMHIAAGAVSIDEALSSFLNDSPSLLAEQLEQLPGKGRDPAAWPAIVFSKSGKTSWPAQQLLGQALGRVIAHEARHEYIGQAHADEGLGRESASITGSPSTANFSNADQQAIFAQLRALEKKQGNATLVPTNPKDLRTKPDAFPF